MIGRKLGRSQSTILMERLIDVTYYQEQTGIHFGNTLLALKHYLKKGAEQGFNPNHYFDTRWYITTYGTNSSSRSALIHFVNLEKAEGHIHQKPSVRFDPQYYLSANPNVGRSPSEALIHFLKFGRAEGRAPNLSVERILNSGLFDLTAYPQHTGIVFAAPIDAIEHYLYESSGRDVDPNSYFDSSWYRRQFGIQGSSAEALLDYISRERSIATGPSIGSKSNIFKDADASPESGVEGSHVGSREDGSRVRIQPSTRFDPEHYFKENPDVTRYSAGALSHYLTIGRAEGRTPSPEIDRVIKSGLFDLEHYRQQTETDFEYLVDAVEHFFDIGADKGLNPNKYFDISWYRFNYGIQGRASDALLDYLENEQYLTRDPSLRFKQNEYLSAYPDLVSEKKSLLSHFLRSGRSESRAPNKRVFIIIQSHLMDQEFYQSQCPQLVCSLLDAAEHYLMHGSSADLNPNPFFDTKWYKRTYLGRDVHETNPIIDFVSRSPAFDRNPSQVFDCRWYLSQNPDVADVVRRSSKYENPLRHYLLVGFREGRIGCPYAGRRDVPIRFTNIAAEPAPTDGRVEFSATFSVKAIDKARRNYSSLRQASIDGHVDQSDNDPLSFPPRPYVASMDSTIVIGGTRLLISDTGTVLSDEIAHFSGSPGWVPRTQFITIDADGKLVLPLIKKYPSRIPVGIHLMHEYAHNYFHFIDEVLPRLLLCDDMDVDTEAPLLLQEGLHPNLKDILEIINIRNRKCIFLEQRRVYQCDRLFFPSDVTSVQDIYERPRRSEETVLHFDLLKRLSNMVVGKHGCVDDTPFRHLYIRRGSLYRGLINESKLEERLISMGFEVVLLDSLSIASQVRLFRQAKVVVAPTGAAVTNILWCRDGTNVLVLTADHPAMPYELWEQHGRISGCIVNYVAGKRAYNMTGEHSIHDDFSVDVEEVVMAISGISQSE